MYLKWKKTFTSKYYQERVGGFVTQNIKKIDNIKW